jgi:hypothetical protein
MNHINRIGRRTLIAAGIILVIALALRLIG